MTHAATVDPPRLPPVRRTLRVVRDAEADVRGKLDDLDAMAGGPPVEAARALALASTLPLEMTLLAACMSEIAAERGASSLLELRLDEPDVYDELRRRMRVLDIGTMLAEHLPRVFAASGLTAAELEALESLPPPGLPALVRQAQAVVAACPIESIEGAAQVAALPDVGHRCRVAYDGLRAFVRRANPARRARLDELGKLYGAGKVSLYECARVLDVDPADLLTELEERGYWRAPAVLALDDAERARVFAALREDRLRREGKREPSAERARRSAVASERIEGVDARPWLPRP